MGLRTRLASGLLALGMLIASPEAQPVFADSGANEPPTVEFPHLEFVGTVSVGETLSGAKKGCKPAGTPISPLMIPCEPDPHDRLCQWIETPVRERYRKYETLLRPHFERLRKIPQSDVAARTKALDDLRQELAPLEPRVVTSIEQAKRVFIETLRRAPSLAPYRDRFERIFGCLHKPVLNVEEQGLGQIAVMDRSWDFTPLLKNAAGGAKEQPFTEVYTSCNLRLTPETWLDCADGGPACVSALFHEFAHLFNSCTIARIGFEAERVMKGLPPQAVDQRHALMKARDEGLQIANSLRSASECLTSLSAPRNSVLKPGTPPAKYPDGWNERCGWDSAPGKPSQWREAESDFWAASTFAVYLEDSTAFPTLERRAHAFYEVSARTCMRELLQAERDGTSKPALAATPKSGAAAQEWDDHQDWGVRLNRNYLGNSDLRAALGCDPAPTTSMSCTPFGGIQIWMPSK